MKSGCCEEDDVNGASGGSSRTDDNKGRTEAGGRNKKGREREFLNMPLGPNNSFGEGVRLKCRVNWGSTKNKQKISVLPAFSTRMLFPMSGLGSGLL